MRKLRATSTPPLLSVSGMIYDSVRREVVVFGGGTRSGYTDDTWTWNGTNWFLKTPSTRPGPRGAHSMFFDLARGKAVLFGGDAPTASLADTWLWDGTNW